MKTRSHMLITVAFAVVVASFEAWAVPRVPVVHGPESALKRLLTVELACWLGSTSIWTNTDTAVVVGRFPLPDDKQANRVSSPVPPAAIPLWCFGASEPNGAIKKLLATSRFLLVLEDRSSKRCTLNYISGDRVIRESYASQDSTSVVADCGRARQWLAEHDVDATMIRAVDDVLSKE